MRTCSTARACTSAYSQRLETGAGGPACCTRPLCAPHTVTARGRSGHIGILRTRHRVKTWMLTPSLSTARQWRPQRSANLTPRQCLAESALDLKSLLLNKIQSWSAGVHAQLVFPGERESPLLALTAWWQCLPGGLSASWARA